MKRFFLMVLVFMCVPRDGFAQNENLDITDTPICFALRNTADYKVHGNFTTEYYVREDGLRTRHRSNFRLEKAGSIDERTGKRNDRSEFCSYGPFFPDRQLILTLRTLFPVFECRTRIDTGQEIVIRGQRKADDSGVETWAECFDPAGAMFGEPKR